ncbi:division/outer membrane stress-associated lipid-binding lipoprotein [Frischella perrara]|uniref:division/outer membrane stress-associated lipid-binding lipoprotein n=1 Tax=Frischella perrara TaxID=1267021 RepID=UPI0023EFA7F7|nr:division/outer membrane stress-associated lipid-binding lipoprotein [Frischella perrara]MCT6876439.1 divisome-associated lipoprotein YraP [Frischella perrara]
MKRITLCVLVVTGILMLQGCVAAVIGAGAGVAKIASDPRTAGKQVDDTAIDSKISLKIKNETDYFKGSRIVVSSYNGNVLLIGQASSQSVIDRVVELANGVDSVEKIYNQIRIGNIISAGTMTNDAWITTNIKTKLIANKNTKARDIKVITENGEVFLLGIVTRDEGYTAGDIASRVSGVKLVTKIFTYLD